VTTHRPTPGSGPREDAGRPLRAGFFHNLPSGGAVRVAGQQLWNLRGRFDWKLTWPEGSAPLQPPSGLPAVEIPFPGHARLVGLRRLLAPILLPRKLGRFERVCSAADRVLRDFGAQVVLVHTSMVLAAPPILYRTRIPTVYFCHEYPRHIYERGITKTRSRSTDLLLVPLKAREKALDRRGTLAADILVANSEFMARRLETVYGREPVVVRPGTDTSFFTPPDDGRPDGSGPVLTVGALQEFKGHHLVVEALGGLDPERRPPMVVIADRGQEGYRSFLLASAARCGVALEIREGISDDALREAYRSAAVVVCPQRNEPYGMVPLEAMACGCPVIAVDQGGFPENVRDGATGLLVGRDPASIARGVARVLGDRELARRLARAGTEFVRRERSAAGEAERIAGLMEQAASG